MIVLLRRSTASYIRKGTNETLYKFIEGVDSNNRIIIDENRKVIEEILQPKYLPNGRWPSKVEHRLSLMQQVAVNQIINMNEKVHSVNRPPRTGKTTLLKDIFAHVMVERAEAMIKLGDPTIAFQKLKTLQLEGYNYPIYEMEIFNYKAIRSNLRLLNFRNQLDLNQSEHRRYLEYPWQAVHLITPLISTTLSAIDCTEDPLSI